MKRLLKSLPIILPLVVANQAFATKLEIDPNASMWAHIGASMLLYLHIGGGTLGIVSGTVAVVARKGQKTHRVAGRVFLVSMLVSYVIAGAVAPFLTDGQRPNVVAAALALYLLVTGVMAAKRRPFYAGPFEVVGLIVVLIITSAGVLFMMMGATSESGTLDGSRWQGFIPFILVGVLALIGDIKSIVRRKLTNTTRVMRHLWRVCLSFFIASVSLFLGQTQLFPEWWVKSPLPFVFAFAPLFIAIGWLIRIKLSHKTQANLTQAIRPVITLSK